MFLTVNTKLRHRNILQSMNDDLVVITIMEMIMNMILLKMLWDNNINTSITIKIKGMINRIQMI